MAQETNAGEFLGNHYHNGFTQNGLSDMAAQIFAQLAEGVLEPGYAAQRLDISALGPDLYHGASGLALFFAAYYRVTKDPRAYQAALAALAPVRSRIDRLLAESGRLQANPVSIGGFIGLGSFLYVLAAAAEWLNAPELLQPASALVETITPELIHADQGLDVMTGAAGTLLGLLYFAHAARTHGVPPGSAVNLAVACGEHLLRSSQVIQWSSARVVALARGKSTSQTTTPRAGFVHGASGISYALARLYRETQLEQFCNAALEGFAFERTLYAPEKQGWLDPFSNKVMEPRSWCFGAPGIALARLGCIAYMGEPAVWQDLEQALHISRTLPDLPIDQLCCGNFGRIDVLQTAGSVLNRPQLTDFARECSRRILEEVSSLQNFRFARPFHEQGNQQPDPFHASLFLGLAGVGYTLLRLSSPELIPSVLLLEVQP